jgi:uncharacterized SAM-binding protein YcdF (DUF218 family)
VRDETRTLAQRTALGFALGGASGLLCDETGLPGAFSYNGSEVFLVLVFAAIGALVALTRARRVALAVPIGLAAFGLLVAYAPLARGLAARTERVDPDEPGDAVFVFSSSVQPDGDPDPGAMARLLHGILLVSGGRAPVLAVSEVWRHGGMEDLARGWLGALHVQAEVVNVGRVANTHDEAVLLAKKAKERGWTRIVAVTSPTHEKRACATLENEGLVAIASPAIETRYDMPGLPDADDRVRAIGPVLHEIVGQWMYRRRGWIK